MKLLDLTNPVHQAILAEEIIRAKQQLLQEQSEDADYGEQPATQNNIGKMYLRSIKSKLDMNSVDPYNKNPYNRLAIKYLDIVNKDTLNDLTTEQAGDLLAKLHDLSAKLGHAKYFPGSTTGGPTEPSKGYMGKSWTGD